MNCHNFLKNLSFLRAQGVLKFEFTAGVIIIFVESIKKGNKWSVNFIGKLKTIMLYIIQAEDLSLFIQFWFSDFLLSQKVVRLGK